MGGRDEAVRFKPIRHIREGSARLRACATSLTCRKQPLPFYTAHLRFGALGSSRAAGISLDLGRKRPAYSRICLLPAAPKQRASLILEVNGEGGRETYKSWGGAHNRTVFTCPLASRSWFLCYVALWSEI